MISNNSMQLIKLLFLGSILSAQPLDLQILAQQFEQTDSERRLIAIAKAQEKGWPISGQRDGRSFAIQALAANGMPLYNVTENINSAQTISTDAVWPGGDASYFLTGLGMTVGIWDNGKVRDTHQEMVGRVQQIDEATELAAHATHVWWYDDRCRGDH